jgi:hypothetical protein
MIIAYIRLQIITKLTLLNPSYRRDIHLIPFECFYFKTVILLYKFCQLCQYFTCLSLDYHVG